MWIKGVGVNDSRGATTGILWVALEGDGACSDRVWSFYGDVLKLDGVGEVKSFLSFYGESERWVEVDIGTAEC